MRYYGKPKIEKVEKRKCEYIRCDICHKKIKGRYFWVNTSHNEWGNDSIDSLRYYDICEKCINNFTINYLKEIPKTGKIEIESMLKMNSSYYGLYNDYEDKLVEEDEYEKGEDK